MNGASLFALREPSLVFQATQTLIILITAGLIHAANACTAFTAVDEPQALDSSSSSSSLYADTARRS